MRIILSTILACLFILVYAQNDSTSAQGEIVTGEVVIEKDKRIILPKASKLYRQAEAKRMESDSLQLGFTVIEPAFEWPPYKSDVPFKRVNDPYPFATHPNYIKLGYGNFNAPLLELGVFQKIGSFDTRSKIFYERFGTGPVNGSNSGNSVGIMDISATHRKEKWELTPSISYTGRRYSFYGNTDRINSGFNPESPDDVATSDFDLSLNYAGTSGDAHYSLEPFINATNQKLTNGTSINQETTIGLYGNLGIKLNDRFSTELALQGISGNYDGGLSYDRSFFKASPGIRYSTEEFRLRAGFNVISSKSGEITDSGFYPDVTGEWYFNKDWSVYGVIGGGVSWNALGDMLNQNEFLDDSLIIRNTETRLEFGGGIKGVLMKNMILDAGIMFSNLEQLPFFVPLLSDSSRYTLTYDEGTVDRFQFTAGLTYSPTNVSTYGASIELNSYSMNSLERPWHLPSYIFKAYTSHNVNEKLIASVSILAMGGLRAPADVSFGIANLDSFLDASMGVKYLITSRASAFVDIDNILGNEYERYLGYPVRRLSFRIGGQYRF